MLKHYTLSSLFERFLVSEPASDGFDPTFVKRYGPVVETLSRYFRPTYHGLDRIPCEGPALLVGNHGILGFDSFFIFMAIYRATGRLPRGLSDYHLFAEPLTRSLWTKMGAIAGTQENAVKYLKAGELVNVYPGGARDAMKRADSRYILHWDKSKGFIEVAMKAKVPIILHMGIGTDDTYRVLGKLGLTGWLMGHSKYQVPVVLGWGLLPRPVKFDYYISEPIELEGQPKDAEDRAVVDRNHQLVWQMGQQMLADGLARRESIWFG